ncbi:helix-turn-helix domain-containing protein [Rhodococcus daqingensis]|uniref:Helix-turn-helix domain-containing protein n=1 Tax=Rhodococcus daqingensis TaxID=2479363 RepID=A0ABW2RXX2_9NOCA
MQLSEVNAIIGAKIAELRNDKSMSQAQLAMALAANLEKERVDPTTITRLERGQRPVTAVELVALAHIFNVSTEELIPRARLVDEQVRTWLRQAGNLSVEVVSVEQELAELRAENDAATALWRAFTVLREYQASGRREGVSDALDDIAHYVESCTEGTPLGLRIDLVEVLRDMELPEELIAAGVEWAEVADDPRAADRIVPTRLARYISKHAPFPFGGGTSE